MCNCKLDESKKKGISLIVLVITIIVVIILASAIILSLQNNNPIKSVKKARIVSDIDTFKSQLELYKQNQYIDKLGVFNPKSVQANSKHLSQDGKEVAGKNIYDVIESLKDSEYNEDDFIVVDGKLVYKGKDSDIIDLGDDQGIVVDKANVNIKIDILQKVPIRSGKDVKCQIEMFSSIGLKDVTMDNINTKLKVTDIDGQDIQNQPSIVVSNISGTDNDKNVICIINTTNMQDGEYKIKIESNAVKNGDDKYNEQVVSNQTFTIDNTAPEKPTFNPSTTEWTNQDITVEIIYPNDSIKNEYSLDGTNWQNYTAPINITSNINIYARAIDKAQNTTEISSLTVTNIDKTIPGIPTINTNGYISGSPTNQNVTMNLLSEDSGSKINKYQVSFDSGINWNDMLSSTYIVDYECSNSLIYRAIDNAGNISQNSQAVVLNIDKTQTTAPEIVPSITTWTNQNITITINYPLDSIKNEYSLDNNTWSVYSEAFAIDKNITIYSRTTDSAGNQNTSSTLNITNIDKDGPSYTNYAINNVTISGYDVYIYEVNDSKSGLANVQVKVWTTSGGQDDLITQNATNQGNGTWYCRVNRHGEEYDQYATEMYIYDNLSNCTLIIANSTTIPSPVPNAPSSLNAAISTGGTLSINWSVPSSYSPITSYTVTVGSVVRTTTGTSISFSYTSTGNVNISVYAISMQGNGIPITHTYNIYKNTTHHEYIDYYVTSWEKWEDYDWTEYDGTHHHGSHVNVSTGSSHTSSDESGTNVDDDGPFTVYRPDGTSYQSGYRRFTTRKTSTPHYATSTETKYYMSYIS